VTDEPDKTEKPGEKPAEDADALRPDMIAERVERALGGETDLERVAREEEQKLIERKRQLKKGKKKPGIEAAASKKLAKIGEKAVAVKRPTAAVATAVESDALLDRALKLRQWARTNARTVRIVVGAAAVALAGASVYLYMQHKRETDASVLLTQGVVDERAQFNAAPPARPDDDEEEDRPTSPYPSFKTVDEGRTAALAKYREVESKYPGTGAAILARLGEAAILLDRQDVAGAEKAYDDVRHSPLAENDAEVRGRALEGSGFAHEEEADKAPAGSDARTKALDAAMSAFKLLENVDAKGMKELGLYHQARIAEKQGDKQHAIDLLKQAHERVAKPGESSSDFPYLQFVVEDRLRALDPSAVPPKPKGGGLAGPGGNIDMNDPRVQKILREYMEKQQQQSGGKEPK
jgi:tetratricopeptide repeat protein